MFSIFYPAVHYVSRMFIIPYIRPDVQSVIRPVGHANKQPAKPYFAGGPFYGTGWRRCGSGWRYALGYKRLNKAVSLSREPIPASPDVPLRMGRRLTGTARTADCPSCPRNILCSGHSKLCFALPEIFSVTQYSLPARGRKLLRSRRFLQGAAYAEVEIFTYPRAFGLSVKI